MVQVATSRESSANLTSKASLQTFPPSDAGARAYTAVARWPAADLLQEHNAF